MKYGIGITTRNRPDVLESALRQHAQFAPADSMFVIVDDQSDDAYSCDELVAEFASKVSNVVFRKSTERLGIARAKNACLSKLIECEHVFLFDDDAWPQRNGWADEWASINEANSVGHSMFNVTADALLELNPAFRAVVRPVASIGADEARMVSFSNCFGVMLYFSRKCLDALGGFPSNTPHLYGYEHAQVSGRANIAGFTQGHQYLTPLIASELIYSIDITYCMLKIAPTFDARWLGNFRSSVTLEESSQAEKNSIIMGIKEVHCPLVDPLEQG